MRMGAQGRAFTGWVGGVHYRRWAALMGMGVGYYRRCVHGITLTQGMRSLDLGCGPGALCFALAEVADPRAEIHGIDISDDQLDYARNHAEDFPCRPEFRNASMAELPYPDGHFDVVTSSMALHETPPEVRRQAIAEVARVLKDAGIFVLVDWGKPRLGLRGVVWLPVLYLCYRHGDNWNNTYPELCQTHSLSLVSDEYITSIARRQVFRKRSQSV